MQKDFWTPPGFSRWYFNFSATTGTQKDFWTPPGFSRWRFNFAANTNHVEFCSAAEKLKYHRLKPGGVQEFVCVPVVAEKLKYHRLKPWWCPGVCLRFQL